LNAVIATIVHGGHSWQCVWRTPEALMPGPIPRSSVVSTAKVAENR